MTDKLKNALGRRKLAPYVPTPHPFCLESDWVLTSYNGGQIIMCKACGRTGRDVTESKAQHYAWLLRKDNTRRG